MNKLVLTAILAASLVSCVRKEDVATPTSNETTNNTTVSTAVIDYGTPPKTITYKEYSLNGTTTYQKKSNLTHADGNKIVSDIGSDGTNINFTYDGDLIIKQDKSTRVMDYKYNAQKQLIEVKTIRGGAVFETETATYDNNGRIISHTVYVHPSNGGDVTLYVGYNYVHEADGTISVNSMKNPSDKTILTIAKGNIVKKVVKNSSATNTYTYTFDDKINPENSSKGLSILDVDRPKDAMITNRNNITSVNVVTSVSGATISQTNNYINTYDASGRITKQEVKETTNGKEYTASSKEYSY
jgi:hypothetical protein